MSLWGTAFAQQEVITLETESINPGSTLYPVKRGWEKLREMMNFSVEDKMNYQRSLLKIRLSELSYVVDKKLLNEFQTSSERFAYQAGILTNILVEQKKQEDKETIKKEFISYSKILDQLRDNHPANTSYWMLIQHDINTLKILSEKLN